MFALTVRGGSMKSFRSFVIDVLQQLSTSSTYESESKVIGWLRRDLVLCVLVKADTVPFSAQVTPDDFASGCLYISLSSRP